MYNGKKHCFGSTFLALLGPDVMTWRDQQPSSCMSLITFSFFYSKGPWSQWPVDWNTKKGHLYHLAYSKGRQECLKTSLKDSGSIRNTEQPVGAASKWKLFEMRKNLNSLILSFHSCGIDTFLAKNPPSFSRMVIPRRWPVFAQVMNVPANTIWFTCKISHLKQRTQSCLDAAIFIFPVE